MTRFNQAEQQASRKIRPYTIEISAEPGLCENQLDISRKRAGKLDLACAALNQIREFGENSRNLGSLLVLQPDQLVVHLENSEGFHEYCRSTRRTAMDDAFDASLLLGADRDNEASKASSMAVRR